MNRFKSTLATAVVVVFAFGISACTTVVTNVAQKALEDRSTEDQITDAKITSGIIDGLAGIDKGLLLDISVDVWEQRVMLTGTLDSAKMKTAVEAVVKKDSRIKAFYNDVQMVSTQEMEARREQAKKKDDAEEGGTGQAVNDFWLETKIKAQLLTAGGVTSVNYFWRSVRNTVYIIGRSGTAAERDKVLSTIRTTEDVKGVKHYIKIIPVS